MCVHIIAIIKSFCMAFMTSTVEKATDCSRGRAGTTSGDDETDSSQTANTAMETVGVRTRICRSALPDPSKHI